MQMQMESNSQGWWAPPVRKEEKSSSSSSSLSLFTFNSQSRAPMDSTKPDEIAYEFLPYLRSYTDGRIERLVDTDFVAPWIEFLGRIFTKDVPILPEIGVSARLFLPKVYPRRKLPLLVYFHGGAFCASSPFCSKYDKYLFSLVYAADVFAVSVDYRRAPEHPIPAAYQDCWAALHWALSHSNGNGPEFWLNEHVDFEKIFLAGDCAGANIAHNLALVAGHPGYGLDPGILGLALIHPLFIGSDQTGSEALDPEGKAVVGRIWSFACPDTNAIDDPRVNPVAKGASSLALLGCQKVLVCVAEKDVLKDRGRVYYEELGRSGWAGAAEFMETEGEGRGFHLNDLAGEKSIELIKRLANFFKGITSH